MINAKWIYAICLIVTLVGCGGGGGGGSDAGTQGQETSGDQTSGDQTAGDNPNSSDSPSAGGGTTSGGGSGTPLASPLTQDVDALITFPATKSVATKSTVTIKGFARDIDGVSEVLVNGVPATLTVLSSTTASKPSSAKPSSTTSRKTDGGEDVYWEAQITVSSGDNEVSVSVTDEQGNTETPDSTSVSYLDVPIEFSLDEDMTRVIGVSTNAFAGYTRSLVDYDYVNQTQNKLRDNFDSSGPSCYKADTSEFFHLVLENGNTLVLHSHDLTTELDSVVLSHSLDPGSEGFSGLLVRNMTCGAGNDSVYVLVNYPAVDGNGFAKSIVLEFDLADSKVETLSKTDTGATSPWISWEIMLADTVLISHGGLNNPSPMVTIDLATGARTALHADTEINALTVASGSTTGAIYAVTFDGVYEINGATGSGSSSNKSSVDDTDPFVFSQVRKAAYDADNHRVIVSDSDLDALIAVDLATGERTELLGRSIGTGNKMIAPRAVQVSADGSKAYVLDDGGNASEKLFVVDLATGNRTVLGNVNQTYNVIAQGLALDEANDRVFVAFDNAILEVNLTSGLTATIASDSVGTGAVIGSISGLLFDADNGRLIVADDGTESLLALNPSTGERTVVSSESAKGMGEPFANVNSMTFNSDKSRVFVSNQQSETIMSVDLASGNRETVLSECPDGTGADVLGTSETLQEVLFDPTRNRLLILGDNILALDLDGMSCSILQPFAGSPLILGLTLKSPEQLLAVTFKALGQYDIDSGEYAIISK